MEGQMYDSQSSSNRVYKLSVMVFFVYFVEDLQSG